ncbi:unnamed protein product [Ambrosiozyma monospora]|uniref:Unnamed protein product n=1 Tax=Ambrosiozyma monospora TaxID=43982 RepID=A0A9W6YKP3_AMBMO|nr:unnamed protein product [Ambrosiozyma monospora]
MFARQALRSSARFGFKPMAARNASSIADQATGALNSTVYWAKVSGEVAKQIYIKEGLAPPTISEFQKVYGEGLSQFLKFTKDPKDYTLQVVGCAKSTSKDQWFRYAAYAVQIFGLFALGEIVGRRQIVGYPSFGPKEHAH